MSLVGGGSSESRRGTLPQNVSKHFHLSIPRLRDPTHGWQQKLGNSTETTATAAEPGKSSNRNAMCPDPSCSLRAASRGRPLQSLLSLQLAHSVPSTSAVGPGTLAYGPEGPFTLSLHHGQPPPSFSLHNHHHSPTTHTRDHRALTTSPALLLHVSRQCSALPRPHADYSAPTAHTTPHYSTPPEGAPLPSSNPRLVLICRPPMSTLSRL